MLDDLSKALARLHQINKCERDKINEINEKIIKVESFFIDGVIDKLFYWKVPLEADYTLTWEPHCTNGKFRVRVHFRDEVTDELKKIPLRECKLPIRMLLAPYLPEFIDAFATELLKD